MMELMSKSDILNTFALFYRRCNAEEWQSAVLADSWMDFITATHMEVWKFNSTKDIASSLYDMPSFSTFERFAGSHYVGGLPDSILPVESLYRNWTDIANSPLLFAHQKGFYDSDSAAHMRFLFSKYGVELAGDNLLEPDHLSLLLSFLALLCQCASSDDVSMFIDEHLSWIPALQTKICMAAPEAEWLHDMTALLIDYLHSLNKTNRENSVLAHENQDNPDKTRHISVGHASIA